MKSKQKNKNGLTLKPGRAKEINKDLVSVGVPVYNEEKHIAGLLTSILNDNYRPKEIIVSDNHSTDGTWEIIQKFVATYENIKAVRQPENQGAAFNFNYVLENARGEFFIWAGGHDIWGPEMVTECVKVLKRNSEFALAVPIVKWIDEKSDFLDKLHCIIDTSSKSTPAGRVEKYLKDYIYCTAIYGLHRKRSLLQTIPLPDTLGPDVVALARIAGGGHIVPVDSSWYGRRLRVNESSIQRQLRHLKVLKVKGLAAKFPNTMFRLSFFSEVLRIKGSFYERMKLIYTFHRRFLGFSIIESIFKDLFPAAYLRLQLKIRKKYECRLQIPGVKPKAIC